MMDKGFNEKRKNKEHTCWKWSKTLLSEHPLKARSHGQRKQKATFPRYLITKQNIPPKAKTVQSGRIRTKKQTTCRNVSPLSGYMELTLT